MSIKLIIERDLMVYVVLCSRQITSLSPRILMGKPVNQLNPQELVVPLIVIFCYYFESVKGFNSLTYCNEIMSNDYA